MFSRSTEPKLEAGFLKSGRRFRSRKRRKTYGGRQTPSLFEESEYEFQSWLDKGSCDEEEDYNPISKGAKEFEESTETPRSGRNYITPGVSPEVRSRASFFEITMNTGSTSVVTSVQGSPPSSNCSLNIPDANSMAGEDIRLPTFNGNGVEDP